ncbi:DUF6960 family protein [Gemmata algarum]|uniref:DUF6960 family protein n=1 Tax=Gemmata algarum TaxID=2975278 RepID=UPI0039C922E5
MNQHGCPEFRIGDRVRVVSSDRHRSPHAGTIREVVWHHKDARYNYYIEERGHKVSTRYLAVDLEPDGS